MLNRIPESIRKSNRAVTLRHPNNMDCELLRKTVTRVSTDTPDEIAGSPTLGGMFVMDSEDEHDYEYNLVGTGKLVNLGIFVTDGSNFQDGDETLTYAGNMIEALIEPTAEEGFDGYFVPDKHDLLNVFLGAGYSRTYEIVGITGNIDIHPYTRRYVLNPREDENVGV